MKQSDVVWGIFAKTGYIDAYLLYLDFLRHEKAREETTNGGAVELS
ncbi:MAG TPA: YqzL family protein [Clostridia bacterium]|nr:YqzL family protein [Clostridia bacterium]